MKYQTTQIMIAFQVEGDRESDLVNLLQMLVQALLFLWDCWQQMNRLQREARALALDCQEAAAFTVKVMVIGLTAWLYGVGVRI